VVSADSRCETVSPVSMENPSHRPLVPEPFLPDDSTHGMRTHITQPIQAQASALSVICFGE